MSASQCVRGRCPACVERSNPQTPPRSLRVHPPTHALYTSPPHTPRESRACPCMYARVCVQCARVRKAPFSHARGTHTGHGHCGTHSDSPDASFSLSLHATPKHVPTPLQSLTRLHALPTSWEGLATRMRMAFVPCVFPLPNGFLPGFLHCLSTVK